MINRLARAGASFRGWLQRSDRWLWLALALTTCAWAALLAPGYFFRAHDARHSVFFLVEFDAALRDGAWWPRWGMDHAYGYGYPLWLFYSPLSYYLAEVFHLLGLGFTAAVKATYIAGFLAAAIAMYAFARRWWGRPAALVAAVAYTYAPYHLADVYVRSALAETMAFIWYPLTLLAFDALVARGGRRRLAWAALTFAGLTLTHTVTGLVFTPLLAAYVLWALWRYRRSDRRGLLVAGGQALLAALLGLGVSAIFVLPMLLERGSIVQAQWVHDTYQYQRHFVYPHQFLSAQWGFGYSVDGPQDGMSFQVGVAIATLALAAVFGRRRRGPVLFMAVATLVLLWGMTGLAEPVWRMVPLAQLVQFPWRLLAPTAVTLAALAGAAVTAWPGDGRWTTAVIAALLLMTASLPYVVPQFTPITAADESALAIVQFETEHPDMVGMTAWTQEMPTDSPMLASLREGRPPERIVIIAGQGQAQTTRIGGASVVGRVQAAEPVTVQFLTYWFPGWQARVDGVVVPSRPEGQFGLLTIDVPPGEHTVAIRMAGTPIRNGGAIISGASLLLVGWLLWRSEERRGS